MKSYDEMEEVQLTISINIEMPACMSATDQEVELLAKIHKAIKDKGIVKVISFKGEAEIYGNK